MAAPDRSSAGSPDPAPALVRLALQAGATSIAHVDVAAMLSAICVALVPAAGVDCAALLLDEPADPRDPEARQVFGSDTAATRLGELQRRSGSGPLPARGDDTLISLDLASAGPPDFAAAAAGCGLVGSLVVPVTIHGTPAGVVQLLARSGREDLLTTHLAAALRPLAVALAARLADVRELARLEQAAADASPLNRVPDTTGGALRLPVPRGPLGRRMAESDPRVPVQRRARHRRPED